MVSMNRELSGFLTEQCEDQSSEMHTGLRQHSVFYTINKNCNVSPAVFLEASLKTPGWKQSIKSLYFK